MLSNLRQKEKSKTRVNKAEGSGISEICIFFIMLSLNWLYLSAFI